MSLPAFFREGRTTSDLDGPVAVEVSAGPGDADLWRVAVGRDLPFFLMNGTVTSCADAILCDCVSVEAMGVGWCWLVSAARWRTDRKGHPDPESATHPLTSALTRDLQILDSTRSGLNV